MRVKIILPVVGLAIFVLLVAGAVRLGAFASAPPPPAPSQVTDSASPIQRVFPRAAMKSPARDLPQPETNPAAASQQRVDELRDLAASKEPNSLDVILSELSNGDLSVRRAALAAAIEFGNRAAIPALQSAMESNPDAQEKVNLQKAISYLQLPSLKEQDLVETGLETNKPN